MRRTILCCVAALWATQLSPKAFADASLSLQTPASTAPLVDRENPFAQGTYALTLATGYEVAPGRDVGGNVAPTTLGINYYVRDNFSAGVEATLNYFEQPSTIGGGMNVILRWHFYTHDDVSFFIDGGGGIIEAAEDVPRPGTRFDFTAHGGLGLTYRLKDNLYFITACRYYHLSNAQIEGKDNNPSIDAVGGYVGLMWTF